MFDFLCFNSGNFDNELEGDYTNVCEEKATTTIIDLMDGCTIPYIQDAGAFLTKEPLYLSRG